MGIEPWSSVASGNTSFPCLAALRNWPSGQFCRRRMGRIPTLPTINKDRIIYNLYMKKTYFVRHGQTDQGLDEPLNSTGKQQANKLADELKEQELDLLISSPLQRAVQTAEIINKFHMCLL